MKTIDYKIDSKSHPLLIYMGCVLIAINLVLKYKFESVDYVNPLAILDQKAMTAFVVDAILLFVRIAMTILAFVIAQRLNRSGLFWGLVVFLFTPISLVILGFLDVKIDHRLKKTLDKHRTDYFVETIKIRNDCKIKKIPQEKVDDLIQKSKLKHQELLTNALTATTIEIEKNQTNDWMHDATRCPACGASVTLSDLQCLKCGLTLKTTNTI